MVVSVVRASDGSAWPLDKSHFNGITSLDQLYDNLLSPLLSIKPECIICMNEEGAQLRDDSLPLLAMRAAEPEPPIPGTSQEAAMAPPQREMRLYVFDRDHLDDDAENVARDLAVTEEELLTEPSLSLHDPLESHVALSAFNLSTLRALIHSISLQCDSLGLALSNLTRVNTGTTTTLSSYRAGASPSLQGWTKLLEGWEANMEAIAKVAVVSGLLGRGVSAGSTGQHSREGSTASALREKERFLGDYVSPDKMLTVKDGCAKVLNDLKSREDGLQEVLGGVLAGTAQVRENFEMTSRDLEDLDACDHDAVQGHLRIEELVRNASEFTDPDLRAECFEELSAIDAESRDRIRFLVERKNAMTRYLVVEMQHISNLQSDVASMPANLAALDHDLRTKTDNFKHIARLEGLIPAYVATVAEVVRRREFARRVSNHSEALVSSLAHLSVTERDRRKHYRIDFSGKLPWEVRGLGAGTDDKIPEIDLGVHNLTVDLPELKRETLDGLRSMLADLEGGDPDESKPDVAPFRKAGDVLDGLLHDLEDLDREFDNISQGHLEPAEQRPDLLKATVQELEGQIRTLEESREALERLIQAERGAREEELAQLNQLNGELAAARSQDENAAQRLRERLSTFEKEKILWDQERNDWSREKRESRDLLDEVVKRANGAATDLRQAANERAELERKVETTESVLEDLKRKLAEAEEDRLALRTELESTQHDLSLARTTISEIENRARGSETKQKELLAIIADRDRVLRDERAEAELNTAVSNNELVDLRRIAAGRDADLELVKARNETLEDMVRGLREQNSRWERTSAEKEKALFEVKAGAEEARRRTELEIVGAHRDLLEAQKLARSSLKFAGRLRDENNQVVAVLSTSTVSKSDSSTDNVDKAVAASSSPRDSSPPSAPATAPLDYDAADLGELLSEVQKYDFSALNDAVRAKVETLTAITKKWSKEAKAYRERAHRAHASASDKIAFRNFAKGDLALFLPTRNSIVPVWAAFNVSFPHHFLSATGTISEQMKSREWIVARITSVSEKVVDAKDPTSNPYLLAPGTKFFLLEVEPFSSKDGGSRSRKHSGVEKVRSARPEERRSHSTGHIRESPSSESSAAALLPLSASTVIVASVPDVRRPSMLPVNATDLARSEFAIVEDPDEEIVSRPQSPTTLRQPVPRSDEEPFGPSPPSSALSRALARSSSPLLNSRPVTCDPFLTGPFEGGTSLDGIVVSPPATDFEPTVTPDGASPAFLPTRKAPSSSGNSPQLGRSPPKPKIEVASSPASTCGSFITFPRSANSGSSILTASIHRRVGAACTSGSPPTTASKAIATQEAQDADSRWKSLTEDLATASTDDLPKKAMTLGRNTKGWPSTRSGDTAQSASRERNVSSSASVFESFIPGRKVATEPQPTGSLAASEIMKRLKTSPGK